MKYTHKSPILQMFVEGRGTAEDLNEKKTTARKAAAEKRREFAKLSKAFAEKVRSDPELSALYDELVISMEEGYDLECDYHYSEGFRFGVLLGLDIAGFIKEE